MFFLNRLKLSLTCLNLDRMPLKYFIITDWKTCIWPNTDSTL